jgi:hypothetical protein
MGCASRWRRDARREERGESGMGADPRTHGLTRTASAPAAREGAGGDGWWLVVGSWSLTFDLCPLTSDL